MVGSLEEMVSAGYNDLVGGLVPLLIFPTMVCLSCPPNPGPPYLHMGLYLPAPLMLGLAT